MIPDRARYAVIFANQRTASDMGYAQATDHLDELARTIEGYCGMQSVRGPDGFGITVSYWDSEAAIDRWRHHPDHKEAKRRGRTTWYESYQIHITRIERQHAYIREDGARDHD